MKSDSTLFIKMESKQYSLILRLHEGLAGYFVLDTMGLAHMEERLTIWSWNTIWVWSCETSGSWGLTYFPQILNERRYGRQLFIHSLRRSGLVESRRNLMDLGLKEGHGSLLMRMELLDFTNQKGLLIELLPVFGTISNLWLENWCLWFGTQMNFQTILMATDLCSAYSQLRLRREIWFATQPSSPPRLIFLTILTTNQSLGRLSISMITDLFWFQAIRLLLNTW